MILAVAAAAILAVSTPASSLDAGAVVGLSRSQPLDAKVPSPAIGCEVPSTRTMAPRREQKPQGLPSYWVGPHQAVSVKADSGGTRRCWYAASGPRSLRAPPQSA
jgi:hypothetical protein